MNTWFVTNDYGDIAGHDLSETHAKILAQELNSKVYYLSDCNSQYMISYDKKATNDFDAVEKYKSENEALNALENLQSEFTDKLIIVEYQDNSNWEALNSEEF